MALRCFDNLSFLHEALVVGAALDEFERSLFLHDLGGAAGEVASSAHRAHQARALHAAGEFANGRKRALVAAFLYLCVYRHVAKSLPRV